MICLRCGYCCKNYFVVIIDNPEKGISQDNMIVHNGNGEPCKHLVGDKPGEFSCGIHDRSWYKETPCFKHGQIEREDSNCRMGEYILKQAHINSP